MSPEFLALSLTAIILVGILSGVVRHIAFLIVNIIFVWGLLLGPYAALTTIAFCILGYILTRLIQWRPCWGFRFSLIVYVLLFIYMRNYDFLRWLLPKGALIYTLSTVGLSFLFFKVVHVMIEAQSGTLGTLHFPVYLNYCLNFTTFMIGPIQRYQDFRDQWHGRNQAMSLQFESHLDAILRILVGFVKVYIIAERLAPLAISRYTDVLGQPLIFLLLRIYAFYFFLYFNFAGYCDVVIGIGCLLGIRPPENFDKPFLAKNISEFWLRFHRSLTEWLTDYVFSPVYKWALEKRWFASRSLLAMSGALLITMLVSGLWHGTTLSFVLFGLTNGIYFVIFRTWDTVASKWLGKHRLRQWRKKWSVQLISMFITFNAVAFSLIFFRLDATQAFQVFARFWDL
jgi:alginate O-acetyltransferase complex protein AlgI